MVPPDLCLGVSTGAGSSPGNTKPPMALAGSPALRVLAYCSTR